MSHTLESLYANCDEVGDCLEWRGRYSCFHPQVYIPRPDGSKGFYRQVRRIIIDMGRSDPLPRVLRCTPSCGNHRCIRREHIVVLTYKQQGARQKAHSPSACAAVARGRRSRPDVKLSLALAREIRLRTESGSVLAKVYGVNKTLISAIRRGEVWREGTAGSSVFAQ